jgi:signal transduction histidine kinase
MFAEHLARVFILLLETRLRARTEALLAAAQRLRDNAPLAQERAERLIAALAQRPSGEQANRLDLHQAVAQAAQLAGFTPLISGQARACVAPSLLARALDNLFANLASVWRNRQTPQPQLHLSTQNARDGSPFCELSFHCPWPADPGGLAAEKLFEPFASGRPGGLGLGLYQARKSLREAQGDLLARPTADGIDFLLRLPTEAACQEAQP